MPKPRIKVMIQRTVSMKNLRRYHMNILLDDFSAKLRRRGIFKLIVWNKGFHETSYKNGLGVVNFAMFKNLIGNSRMSHIKTFINTPGLLLMGRQHAD
jgi:hypothetical protein